MDASHHPRFNQMRGEFLEPALSNWVPFYDLFQPGVPPGG